MDKIRMEELIDKELDDFFKIIAGKLTSEELHQLCNCFNHIGAYLETYYKIYYETKK